MSWLGSSFLSARSIFVTVDLLTEYAGVGAAEQERQCGLAIDRVPLPPDGNARIRN